MTIRDYTIEYALIEMENCIDNSNDKTLQSIDLMRNAGCYVLARDRAIALGEDVSDYPKSIGKINWKLF